jgi:hypothetical protein
LRQASDIVVSVWSLFPCQLKHLAAGAIVKAADKTTNKITFKERKSKCNTELRSAIEEFAAFVNLWFGKEKVDAGTFFYARLLEMEVLIVVNSSRLFDRIWGLV